MGGLWQPSEFTIEKSLPREHTVSFFKIIPLQNEILMPKGCFLMQNMRLYVLNDYK